MLAWQQIKQGRCKGCGGDLVETTNPDNEDAYDGHVVRCFKCAARDRANEEFTSQEGSSRAGLLVYATGGPEMTVS